MTRRGKGSLMGYSVRIIAASVAADTNWYAAVSDQPKERKLGVSHAISRESGGRSPSSSRPRTQVRTLSARHGWQPD